MISPLKKGRSQMPAKKGQSSNSAKLNTQKAKKRPPPPKRPKNSERRKREYLTDSEIERLIKAATQNGRQGLRDGAIVLIMFRHGLRASELTALRWEQVDLKKALVHVRRIKNGTHSTHPLRGPELRLLRQLERLHPHSAYVFISERKAPLTSRSVHHIIARAGKNAKLPFTVHPHMLRHSTGFYLASHGHDTRAIQGYLGHANINNTVIYTQLSPKRFKDFWQD